jgi:hypothetical protein
VIIATFVDQFIALARWRPCAFFLDGSGAAFYGTPGAAERLTARLKRPLRTYRAFAQEGGSGMAEAGQYLPLIAFPCK